MKRRRATVGLVFVLALGFYCCGVLGRCEGDSCPEESREARANGLLGGAAVQQCSRTKEYPWDGTKLKPVEFEAPVVDLRWAGLNHDYDRYVFAITEPLEPVVGGHVWRSDNYGRVGSWTDVTKQMSDALKQRKGTDGDLAGILDLYFHTDHPEKILFAGPALNHWITEDFGRTYTKVDTPGRTLGFWHELKIHPNRPDWILAKVRRSVCEEWDASTNPWCAYDLFVSQDFGKGWMNLTENSKGAIASFWDFDWGANIHRNERRAFPDETILATVYERADHMKGLTPGWDKDMHFVHSTDFFKSAHTRLVACGNQFEVIGHKIFLALPSNCPTDPDGSSRSIDGQTKADSVVLYASADEAQTFEQVCLPVKWLDLGYNLVKTHDGASAFLVVDHDEEDMIAKRAPMGNIYAPGYNNTLYSLSMTMNFRRRYITDFGRIEGIPGVYMANQLSSKMLTDPSAMRGLDFEKFIQTKITFNGGGHWQDLAKPQHYRHGVCDQCANRGDSSSCKLHLHGPSSWHDGPGGRPSFYSHENAPGIVMAVGNTGEFLEFAADAMCTWLSRDGGATWEDVAPNAGIYEYGDHGGLLILASHETEGPTDSLKFSLDQGACWHTIRLEEAIDIQNIRVEPKATSHVFVVHGQACLTTPAHPTCTHTKEGTKPVGKIYVVDLKPVLGSDWRDCGAEDYEKWSPPQPDKCLMGRNITMERRRRSSDCFNGKEYERAETSSSTCQCTQVDVECEYGYERHAEECRPIFGLESAKCAVLDRENYVISETKHRLIDGDSCKGLSQIIGDTDGKGNLPGGHHGRHPNRGWGGATLFLIMLGVVGVLGAAALWWFKFAGDELRAMVEETAAPVIGGMASAWQWLVDAVLRLKERAMGVSQAQAGYERDSFFQPLAGGDFGLDEEELREPAPLNGH
ncbi:g3408 [Coccomyxa viridis]|uniref:G3408 protein n=1 Tax=Coccomyxa viridis TaxID=1274662 RepID=A0ABP1FMQ8_9CHLO